MPLRAPHGDLFSGRTWFVEDVIAELSPVGPPIQQIASPFIISAGLGALIGLVKQWAWQQDHPQEAEYAGVTDQDAITLTMARSVTEQTVSAPLAARGIIVAAISNSVLKAVLAASLGSPALRWRVLVVMALTTAAGVVSFFLI